MSIESIVRDEIVSEFDGLKKMELGTEQYDKTVNGVSKIIDKLNELEKVEIEKQKLDNEERKLDIEERRLESDLKDQKIKNGLSAANLATGVLITGVGTYLMFLFETKGSVTSRFGGKILDRIFRMK